MRHHLLLIGTIALAVLAQACTGGAITDPNNNQITGTTNFYSVTFHNTTTGQTYESVVDTKGYFGFDPYAPAGGSNNAVLIPGGTYQVYVQQPGNIFQTPFTIEHNPSSNSTCPDYYLNLKSQEPCALYQLQLLDSTAQPPAPYPSNFEGLTTTVIPLAPLYYPSITVSQNGELYTVDGTGFVPNGLAFFKATAVPSGELLDDRSPSADGNGNFSMTIDMCVAPGDRDTGAAFQGYDQTNKIWTNVVNMSPLHLCE
jgi:hypothetical protein